MFIQKFLQNFQNSHLSQSNNNFSNNGLSTNTTIAYKKYLFQFIYLNFTSWNGLIVTWFRLTQQWVYTATISTASSTTLEFSIWWITTPIFWIAKATEKSPKYSNFFWLTTFEKLNNCVDHESMDQYCLHNYHFFGKKLGTLKMCSCSCPIYHRHFSCQHVSKFPWFFPNQTTRTLKQNFINLFE